MLERGLVYTIGKHNILFYDHYDYETVLEFLISKILRFKGIFYDFNF